MLRLYEILRRQILYNYFLIKENVLWNLTLFILNFVCSDGFVEILRQLSWTKLHTHTISRSAFVYLDIE